MFSLLSFKPYFIKKYGLILCLFFYYWCNAQLENSNLILNSRYSLKFSSNTTYPVLDSANYGTNVYPINLFQYEGVQSISNKKGNLIFYTDGKFVWDSTFNIMQNGTLTGLKNNYSLDFYFIAHSIILPNLNNENQYYIITNDHINKKNSISIVDMSLNKNKGGILENQKMFLFTNEYFENFNAIASDSCRGIWLIGQNNNRIKVFKLHADGIKLSHTINTNSRSSEGLIYNNQVSYDGSLFPKLTEINGKNIIEIYEFNKKNGYFNIFPKYTINFNLLTLTSNNLFYNPPKTFFISKKNTYLYFGIMDEKDYLKPKLFRVNLKTLPISSSLELLDSNNLSINYYLAKDGKVYKSRVFTNSNNLYPPNISYGNIEVIDDPDSPNLSFENYSKVLYTFDKRKLPNMPYQGLVNYYGKAQVRPRITLPTQQVCTQTPFVLSADVSSLPGVQSGKQMWYLNDTTNDSYDPTKIISFSPNDNFSFDTPGVYKLSFRHEECMEHTTITVTSPVVANVPPQNTICEGSPLVLTTSGSVFVAKDNAPVAHPVSISGIYSYTFAGCGTVSGVFELSQINKPSVAMPAKIATCVDEKVALNPSFNTSTGQNIRWSTGATTPTITVNGAGFYTITVSNACFKEQKTTQVSYNEKTKNLPLLDTLCEGKILLLTTTGSVLVAKDNIVVNPSLTTGGFYSYTLLGCNTTTGTFTLTHIAKPNLSMPTSIVGCVPQQVLILPSFSTSVGQNLVWSNGSTLPNITVGGAGFYTMTVSNACFKEQKTTQVQFYQKPILQQPTQDTTLCQGQKIEINATENVFAKDMNSNKTYNFGTKAIITIAGNYALQASNACYTTTGSLALQIDNIPQFATPNDTTLCDETSLATTVLSNNSPNTSIVWLDNSSTQNSRTISQAGRYEVVVKNACGEYKKAFNITFASTGIGYKGTNIFTPNGDGKNDEWQPVSQLADSYQLQIHNRWGLVVHQSTEWNEPWLATNSPDGLYFYHISYTDCNKQPKSIKGWVEVLR